MRLRFTKMHGAGNDFVMIDAISQKTRLNPDKIRLLADRRFGVGCDQVLIVEHPTRTDVDFRYRIFNADGSEVENCGNGARCFAKFVRERKLTGRKTIRVETKAGVLELRVLDSGNVLVDMGQPKLNPADLPFSRDQQAASYSLQLQQSSIKVGAVSMGNPHAIMQVDNVDTAAVASLGPEIENHRDFPQRVNAGFMQVLSRQQIKLRVYERGVGETLACGTGACAAVVSGISQGLLDPEVKVNLPGGILEISWQGLGHSVMMSGPATTVFHGQIRI